MMVGFALVCFKFWDSSFNTKNTKEHKGHEGHEGFS